MGLVAREEQLKMHGAHPDQQKKRPGGADGETEMRLPGGTVGVKRNVL